MTVPTKPTDPRRLAFDILERVQGGGYADRTLDATLQRHPRLDPRDRALITELVYGVLRQQGRLDYALAAFCKQPLAKLESRVLLLLRLGAYQLLCLDRIPASAAVDTTVQLARQLQLERATGFVNGVLRGLGRGAAALTWPDAAHQPLAHLQHALSLPQWLARRWLAELGTDGALRLAAAQLEPAPLTLRVNTLKLDRDRFLAALAAAGHRAEPTRFAPDGVVIRERAPGTLPGDREGWYQVQDEASMLIAPLLAPQPGEALLDVCAAPGGKTTHLAALTGNRAAITALDLHPQRVRLVEQGAARLGCGGITARTWDVTLPPPFLAPDSFDGVLVDAPCSGLGVLHRNPEARWRLQPADLTVLAERQAMILHQAAALVKPGGRLVYAVCTLTPEETDRQVAAFLARHPEFRLQPLTGVVPADWRELLDAHGCLRSWPGHLEVDGFFAARLIRT
ncbi:MAG TPA: 16S rRNA (cytosine(967)-C(5))-methyltransferase RsmB [Candidatus Eisenbacteria bacterium]|nr:16S rRNA (cytosine(967)-C(5))-methyltransferase RsmB [Candidatus Eisenbacteria bacterium]